MENSSETDVDTIMQEKGADRKLTENQSILCEKLGEGMGNEMGTQSKSTGVTSEHLQSGYASVDEHKAYYRKQNGEPGGVLLNDSRKENLQHGDENAATGQQRPKVSNWKQILCDKYYTFIATFFSIIYEIAYSYLNGSH